MKTLFLCLALCLLVACGTTPKADEYRVRTEYVTVPCEPPLIQRPSWPVDALPLGSPVDAQMRALRAERKAAKGYIILLEAAVEACRQPPAPGSPPPERR